MRAAREPQAGATFSNQAVSAVRREGPRTFPWYLQVPCNMSLVRILWPSAAVSLPSQGGTTKTPLREGCCGFFQSDKLTQRKTRSSLGVVQKPLCRIAIGADGSPATPCGQL